MLGGELKYEVAAQWPVQFFNSFELWKAASIGFPHPHFSIKHDVKCGDEVAVEGYPAATQRPTPGVLLFRAPSLG